MPFSGWSNDVVEGDECGWGRYLSGVQLVDWANDALALRGVAPSIGQARRGLLHEGRLLTMSDERVESFDITNRESPRKTADLPIARMVTHTTATGDAVLRVSQNWWTSVTELDVTTVDAVGSPVSLGSLSLPELDDRNSCYSSSWLGDVYSSGSHAYLVYQTYGYDPGQGTSQESVRVLTVDLSDHTAPRLVGNTEVEIDPSYYYWGYYYGAASLVRSGANIVAHGSTLVVSGRTLEWSEDDAYRSANGKLEVVDLSNPTSPRVSHVPMPDSLGFTGLLVSGSIVATSHYEASPLGNGRVRFYLDRVDLSNPRSPVTLPKVSIPGSLVAYDAESGNAVTSDYRQVERATTYKQCNEEFAGSFRPVSEPFDYERGVGICTIVEQTLRLVHVEDGVATLIDSERLELGEIVGATALGDDRLFFSVNRPHYYSYYGDYYYGGYSFQERTVPIVVLSGIRSGAFEAARVEVDAGNNWGDVPLVARGTSAVLSTGFLGKLAVVSAADPTNPRVVRESQLDGYAQDLDVVGDTAVASMGFDGAQAISLAE